MARSCTSVLGRLGEFLGSSYFLRTVCPIISVSCTVATLLFSIIFVSLLSKRAACGIADEHSCLSSRHFFSTPTYFKYGDSNYASQLYYASSVLALALPVVWGVAYGLCLWRQRRFYMKCEALLPSVIKKHTQWAGLDTLSKRLTSSVPDGSTEKLETAVAARHNLAPPDTLNNSKQIKTEATPPLPKESAGSPLKKGISCELQTEFAQEKAKLRLIVARHLGFVCSFIILFFLLCLSYIQVVFSVRSLCRMKSLVAEQPGAELPYDTFTAVTQQACTETTPFILTALVFALLALFYGYLPFLIKSKNKFQTYALVSTALRLIVTFYILQFTIDLAVFNSHLFNQLEALGITSLSAFDFDIGIPSAAASGTLNAPYIKVLSALKFTASSFGVHHVMSWNFFYFTFFFFVSVYGWFAVFTRNRLLLFFFLIIDCLAIFVVLSSSLVNINAYYLAGVLCSIQQYPVTTTAEAFFAAGMMCTRRVNYFVTVCFHVLYGTLATIQVVPTLVCLRKTPNAAIISKSLL